MRRVLALTLMTLALASPAGADQKPTPKAKASPPAAVVVVPQTALAPLIPLASSRPGGDAGQCKAACARSYYFCRTGDDDVCPSQWAQCAARCTATYRRLGS